MTVLSHRYLVESYHIGIYNLAQSYHIGDHIGDHIGIWLAMVTGWWVALAHQSLQ